MNKRNLEKTHNLGRILCAGVFVALLALTMVPPIYANKIQVGTPTLTGQNAAQNYTYV